MKLAFLLFIVISNTFGLELNSGDNKVHLLELYTSESCSSCPPAEKFVSQFKDSNKLWKKVIPLSFHVAYWNHLHWKDKFSKKEFSQRQRIGARKIKSSVYTPQLLLDGVDVPNNRILSLIEKEIPVGNLNVSLSKDLSEAKINFSSKEKISSRDYFCHAAVLLSGSKVKITSGENSGKTLKEDFIVLDEFKMKAKKTANSLTCKLAIDVEKAKHQSLVFWIVDSESNQVIQAVGQDLKS